MRTLIIFCLFLCTPFTFLAAESRSEDLVRDSGIIENNLVREGCMNYMTAPVGSLTAKREYFAFRGGERHVLYKVVLKKKSVFFLFINETASGYTEWGRGHYFIKRDRASGRFESIGVPYRDDAGCYLEIFSHDGFTLMNVYLFDRLIHREVHLPAPLEKLLTAPLSSVLDMSRGTVDWPVLVLSGVRPEDRRMRQVLNAIQKELPRVREAEDGALDSRGEFVTIKDGKKQSSRGGFNCSGFMKWLVDGWYYPLAGALMDIDTLKARHPDRRGTRWSARDEDTADPFFGLDWTRNIATALASAQTGSGPIDSEAEDVRQVPFLDYREDKGYSVSDLKEALFLLAVDGPGTIYLGAVNDIPVTHPLREEYFHVAAFFPYFDEAGTFHVAVMDQHKNPDLDGFMKKYASCSIHLVRIRLQGDFSLFHIE